jgi:hypothetical protein
LEAYSTLIRTVKHSQHKRTEDRDTNYNYSHFFPLNFLNIKVSRYEDN